jgi:putative ubiquitin-RnfH superfamily antitoxin RatB of RatAB toxin-antitoxin module
MEEEVVVKRGRKAEQHVQRVQFHTGVQIGNSVRNSLDATKDKVQMTMCHHGVFIKTETDQYIVGMPDILWVKLKADKD